MRSKIFYKPEGKRHCDALGIDGIDNIKMDLKGIVPEVVY
jgi:hypothetical protein